MKTELVKIEKLIEGGQGLGRVQEGENEGKVVMAWNALPEELVKVEVQKEKKSYIEGIATNIIESSEHRQEPKAEHFLSTSPWQILSFAEENKWKQKIAQETYSEIGDLDEKKLKNLEVESNGQQYGYRNKIEYSFTENDDGEICLAFYKRGEHYKIPVDKSYLADENINETAEKILQWVREEYINIHNLKSLIIRSNHKETIAGLFIKDKIEFDTFPQLDDKFKGFKIYYSTPKSPASRPTELLYESGQDWLEVELKDKNIKFGLLSFFQINIPLFEQALSDFEKYLPEDKEILDFYSGVGAISIPLSENIDSAKLVDSGEEEIEFAQENISENSLFEKYSAKCSEAREVLEFIDSDKCVIFDPPRAGLHKDVVSRTLEEKPERVLYMSCNISTQARDLEKLTDKYEIKFLKLYNFFPRTPHLEAFCVLDIK